MGLEDHPGMPNPETEISPEIHELFELVMNEQAQEADAVVWLEGDGSDRGAKCIELLRAGFSDTIVLSGGVENKLGEENLPAAAMASWLKEQGIEHKTIIEEGRSQHTRGQAEEVLELAKQKGWKRILLVVLLTIKCGLF